MSMSELFKAGGNKKRQRGLEERLTNHPQLMAKIEAILDIIENKSGELDRADDVEELLIKELRKMGQDVFHGWANNQQRKKEEEGNKRQKAHRHGKKKFIGTHPLD